MASISPTTNVEKESSVKVKPNDGDEIEVSHSAARISGHLGRFQSGISQFNS